MSRIRKKQVFILASLICSLMCFLPVRRSEFLTHIVFLLSEELLQFLARQVYSQQIPSFFFFLPEQVFLLHF